MPPSALPWIEETDYPRFQRVIAELQHTSYEEWAEDHRKAVAYRTPRNGSTDIPVSPDQFDLWLKQTQQAPHMELLWVYAEEKAAQLSVQEA
jgi:hypothetical protein